MGNDMQEIKTQVMDLLNQIVILTKGIKGVDTGVENWNYQPVGISELLENGPEEYEDNKSSQKFFEMTPEQQQNLRSQDYLSNVNNICLRITSESGAEGNEKQYYNSNC